MNNKKLTLEELNHVQREVSYNTKSVPLTYILSIFLGCLGIHRAYFGKNRSAIIRSIVTLINGVVLFMIVSNMADIDVNSELVTDVLAYNAALAISLIIFTITNISWSILDLFLIPKWKRNLDSDLRKEATEKLIQARYVSEHLLKEQLSKELIEQTKKEIVIKVDEMLKFMDEEKLSELGKTLMPALEEEPAFNEQPEEESVQAESHEEPYEEPIEEEIHEDLVEEVVQEETYEKPIKEEIAEDKVKQESLNENVIEEVYQEKQSSKMESPLKIALQEYLDKKQELESKDAPKGDLVKQNDIEESSIAEIESVSNEEKENKQDDDVSEDKE